MRKYGLAFTPLAGGILLALVWQSGVFANAIVFLRADVGTLFLFLGFAASAAWLGIVVAQTRRADRLARIEERTRAEHADFHHRFVRRLDHEIKNPITAIRAGLANLDHGNGTILPDVRAQVDRLARISMDLRKLTELETQPIEMEPVRLDQLFNEILATVKERADASARTLFLNITQVPWPLPPIAGDRDLLFLALHNLVDNALKFSPPGALIELRAFEDGPSVAVEVADTGPGVPAEELAHLGEELYRGAAAMSVEGSGLGLALVRAVVARHHGTLAIRSRPGRGTVVALRFPSAR